MSGPLTPSTTTFLGLDATGGGPFGSASPSMFQLVAQVKPLSMGMGKPLVTRNMPEPGPPHPSGSHQFMTIPPPFKSLPVPPVPSYGPIRSAAEASSNDFENV